MTVDSVLYNTKVFFKGKLVDAGIAIDEGKIVKIAKVPNLPKASERIDLNGNITLPGLIDIHVHLRDQKLAYKETFHTGTAAAAAGGMTTVIDMPNNNPVTMDSLALKQRMKLAEKNLFVNVGFNSAFPADLSEIPKIVEAGAVGFKVYLANGLGGINVDDDQSLLKYFKKVSEYKIPILIHAEDRLTIESKKISLQKGKNFDLMSYVKSHSSEAEARSIKRIISLVKNFNIAVHFCHLSSELGLKEILLAKKAKLPVTCEVTPHNLFLSSEKYNVFKTLGLTDPPLRKNKDVKSLWRAVTHGLIDIIASDHAPHTLSEKRAKSVWDVSPGIPGLETTLSLLLDQINKGEFSIQKLVQLMAENPAKMFSLGYRGFLLEKNRADLVVVDLKKEHVIDSNSFLSKSKYSPFDKMKLKGKAIKTIVNGVLVMDEGQIMSVPPPGNILNKSS